MNRFERGRRTRLGDRNRPKEPALQLSLGFLVSPNKRSLPARAVVGRRLLLLLYLAVRELVPGNAVNNCALRAFALAA